MSKIPNDIKDDEIRIIHRDSNAASRFEVQEHKRRYEEHSNIPQDEEYSLMPPIPQKRRKVSIWWIVIPLVILALLIAFSAIALLNYAPGEVSRLRQYKGRVLTSPKPKEYVDIKDTMVAGQPLTLLTPRNATPRLRLGPDAIDDTSAVLAVQAADVRGDNGEVLGAFVLDGELISKGHSKSGFCAIIDGKPIIGVADNTPFLEQAIESNGYFFRQYPLVVGGQSVDNRLKLSSLRKALAQLNGETVVITSHNKMTLNEFSEVLTELGVTNAIYLVGSTSYGFARKKDGGMVEFGERVADPSPNTNYIIWE